MRFPGLTGLLFELADYMGADKAALELACHFGDLDIKIPVRPTTKQKISVACGFEVAWALAKIYPGETICVPLNPVNVLKSKILAMRSKVILITIRRSPEVMRQPDVTRNQKSAVTVRSTKSTVRFVSGWKALEAMPSRTRTCNKLINSQLFNHMRVREK